MERYYSSAALGMYSMALKVLSLPTSLLATPVNRVYFQEASQRYNRGEDIGEFSFKILKANIKIAIIPISILIIFGEWIFALFLVEQGRVPDLFVLRGLPVGLLCDREPQSAQFGGRGVHTAV